MKPLTERQLKLVTMAAQGYGAKQAAYALGVERQTITNHWMKIRNKLGAETQAHAVYLVFGNCGDDENERV